MSLGLGILLAALAALIVWQVDKHGKWSAFRKASTWLVLVLVALVIALGAYVWTNNFSSERERDARVAEVRERGVGEYWGLRPGMSEGEVLYAKGEPRRRGTIGWEYGTERESHTYMVSWSSDKRVETIQCLGSGQGCETILGIALGTPESSIRSILGEPRKPAEISEDGHKMMAYGSEQRGQVVLILQKDRVVQIVVAGGNRT